MAAAKPALSFSFSKKAEPKRVVEALVKERKVEDKRVAISGVEGGHVTVDGPTEEATKLTIPCKNPLAEVKAANPTARRTEVPVTATADIPKTVTSPDDLPAGIMQRNLAKLSDEDAEAMRELLKDASRDEDGERMRIDAAPILMREGSKRARDGDAPEATKDMFDKVPVESFGEALLRGMGFDPHKHGTKPVYYDKPRDNLLGLGAKALLPHEKAAAKKKAKPASCAGSGDAAGPSNDARPGGENGAGNGSTAFKEQTAAAPGHVDAGSAARDRLHATASSTSATDGAPAAKRKRVIDVWPSRGLVVRVVGQDGQLRKFFGSEAVVLEVDEGSGSCRIKARPAGDANAKSQVLHGVHVAELETRVSRDCEAVRVVRGPHRGAKVKLLRRDAKRAIALIRLNGSETEMPLDDV
eukprot:CAMPEP_0117574710 /NCGR_PEP_ID=MMETSP0784-20121206/61761_1 /TAXON_ID=39447 /ORGANISM="" /LENGTH=412 /DNA_ID=CAMNT_0005373617 /DNA_START=1 /DNA_END=1236 /DNA_ORIENTATION=-